MSTSHLQRLAWPTYDRRAAERHDAHELPPLAGRALPRILMLAEGDPEDASASGSGTPRFVIDHLRALGAEVVPGDVELYGLPKLAALLRAWSPSRPRWVAKYRLGPAAYALRSANAARCARAQHGRADVVLQYGGTFRAGPGALPYYLYCDSNTKLSSVERRSWGAQLSRRQLAAAIEEQRRTYLGAAGIFTFSEYVRESFVRDFGVPADRVVTVHAGPNVDATPESLPVRTARAAGAAPTILFVGREFERKGGPVLVEAFRRIRAVVPEARLLVAGPTELDETVREAPGVEFLGYLRKSDPSDAARLREAFARADVFAFPTRHEPFGIVVLEAMLAGLPVVATNIWAIPEMVQEDRTGFLVPRDDAATLGDRLLRLLTDPALAARMGAAGRERALARFTWPRVAHTMLSVMTRDAEAARRG